MSHTQEDRLSESVQIAHLSMLQGTIARMGSNSFSLKALSATFGSAAVAVTASVDRPTLYYAVSAAIPILIFWMMDAQYVRYERAFRRLFDHVRKGQSIEPYSIDPAPFMKDIGPVLKLAFSWSVFPFYGAILLSFGLVVSLFLDGVS